MIAIITKIVTESFDFIIRNKDILTDFMIFEYIVEIDILNNFFLYILLLFSYIF